VARALYLLWQNIVKKLILNEEDKFQLIQGIFQGNPMTDSDSNNSKQPIIMSDAELLDLWKRMGISFLPEIEPRVAAGVLRELENNLALCLSKKLDILARLNSKKTKELEALTVHISSLRQLRTIKLQPIDYAGYGGWSIEVVYPSQMTYCPSIPSPNNYIDYGLRWLTEHAIYQEEIPSKYLCISYLMLCAFSGDCRIRVRSGGDFLLMLLQFDHNFSAHCLGKAIQYTLDSFPLSAIADLDDERFINKTNHGNALHKLGHLSEALASYDNALMLCQVESLKSKIQLDAAKAGLLANRSSILRELGRLQEAIADINLAWKLYQGKNLKDQQQLDANRAGLQVNLGSTLSSLGRPAEALKAYDKAWRILHGKSLRGRADMEIFRVTTQIHRCNVLCKLGRLEEALATIDLAWTLFQKQNLKEHSKLDATPALIQMNRGVVLVHLKFATEALESLDNAWSLYQGESLKARIELDDKRALTQMNRGDALLMLGHLTEALAAIEKAWVLYQGENLKHRIELDDKRANIQSVRSIILLRMNRLSEAFNAINKALELYQEESLKNRTELNIDRARSRVNLGNVLSELFHIEAAQAAYEEAYLLFQEEKLQGRTHFDVDIVKAQMNCSIGLCKMGKISEAIAIFDKGWLLLQSENLQNHTEIDDLRASAQTTYGSLLFFNSRLPEALEAYDKAWLFYQGESLRKRAELDASRALTQMNRGKTLANLERQNEALSAYDHAWALYQGENLKLCKELDIERAYLFCSSIILMSKMEHLCTWALERSQFLCQFLEMAPAPDLPAPDLSDIYLWQHLKLRGYFEDFHILWFKYCLETGAYEHLPVILSLLQGRKLAGTILDELDHSENLLNTPESVKQLKKLRLEIRKMDANIRELIAGGVDRFQDDGLRAAAVPERPVSPERQQQLDALRANRYQTFDRYLQQRNRVAEEVPDFQILQPYHDRLRLEELGRTLKPGQALAMLMDFSSDNQADIVPIQGVLMLRSEQPAAWQPLTGLHELVEKFNAYNDALSGRGLRHHRDVSSSETPSVPTMTREQLAAFWPDMATQMQRKFWQPLAGHLAGIEELIVIGHGRLYVLPIEAGAPEGLRIRHYPGLIFYGMHQGLLGAASANPQPSQNESPLNQLGILAYPGAQGDIPCTLVESDFLEDLWHSPPRREAQIGEAGLGWETILSKQQSLLHIASHGSGTAPDNPDLCRLDAGWRFDESSGQTEPLWITMPMLFRLGPQPERVFLSACLAAQVAEDLDGDPLGIVSGFFLRGTRQLIGAVSPLPDVWMPVFSALFYQALLNDPDHSLYSALAVAKQRIGTGDWVNDAQLSPMIRKAFGVRLENWYWDLASPNSQASDSWQVLWEGQLRAEFERYGLSEERLRSLERALQSIPRTDRRAFGRLCSQAVVDYVFEQKVPPAIYLDTLRYAIRYYG
jgi:tetratricopeptide (TPR) repeat protein